MESLCFKHVYLILVSFLACILCCSLAMFKKIFGASSSRGEEAAELEINMEYLHMQAEPNNESYYLDLADEEDREFHFLPQCPLGGGCNKNFKKHNWSWQGKEQVLKYFAHHLLKSGVHEGLSEEELADAYASASEQIASEVSTFALRKKAQEKFEKQEQQRQEKERAKQQDIERRAAVLEQQQKEKDEMLRQQRQEEAALLSQQQMERRSLQENLQWQQQQQAMLNQYGPMHHKASGMDVGGAPGKGGGKGSVSRMDGGKASSWDAHGMGGGKASWQGTGGGKAAWDTETDGGKGPSWGAENDGGKGSWFRPQDDGKGKDGGDFGKAYGKAADGKAADGKGFAGSAQGPWNAAEDRIVVAAVRQPVAPVARDRDITLNEGSARLLLQSLQRAEMATKAARDQLTHELQTIAAARNLLEAHIDPSAIARLVANRD